MSKLFMLSAHIEKRDGYLLTTNILQGYQEALDEDQARGLFFTTVMDKKAGFSIVQMLCMEIPLSSLKEILERNDGA